MADGSTMPASLQALAATRHEQAGLAREINAVQSAAQALLQSGQAQPGFYSESLQAQHDKLRDLYERAYRAATEEARLANEVIAGSRACLRRRERERKAAAARLAAEESASEEESEPEEYDERAAAAAAAAPAAPIRPTLMLSRFDKLNIWSYDPANPLPPGSEVAALTDQHSIPPLWIQCKVKRYLPGARPRYEVVDEDAGEAAGGAGMEDAGDEPAVAPVPRQKLYTLDVRKILPLPSLALVPLSKRREFPRGTRVIAVFPTGGITTLYPAEVIETPRTNKRAAGAAGGGKGAGAGAGAAAGAAAAGTDYVLMFDDDEDCHRPVNAQFVAPIPEMLAAD